ncbi:MAG: hypothetical protein M3Q98_12995 [Actinomycetota bacterium]|nr:hypothetical protein [Actinomycetota bacterium]
MNGLSELGAAEPTPYQLAQIVARSLGVAEVTVESVEVETVEYSLETMTTGGRFWVHGTARVGDRPEPFRIFVKIPQSVARSPVLAMIPPQFQEQVVATLPWQIEPNAYRSTLTASVPAPMRLPRCFGVIDLDDQSAAMWLESVDYDDSAWDVDRYGRAARMLGSFAADRTVAAIDLTQLVISEIQLGLRPGTELPEIRSICLDGYREGPSDNGIEVPAAELSRAHGIQAAIAGAITALPIELFDEPVTPELQDLAASRAESAHILLDAVSF